MMRTDCFSQESIFAAYQLAAEKSNANFSEFSENSKVFNFAVTSLGSGLAMDVECDTGLPVSTPAEKREKLFQQKLKQSQERANKIADRQRKVAENLAKKMTRKMSKELRSKK